MIGSWDEEETADVLADKDATLEAVDCEASIAHPAPLFRLDVDVGQEAPLEREKREERSVGRIGAPDRSKIDPLVETASQNVGRSVRRRDAEREGETIARPRRNGNKGDVVKHPLGIVAGGKTLEDLVERAIAPHDCHKGGIMQRVGIERSDPPPAVACALCGVDNDLVQPH